MRTPTAPPFPAVGVARGWVCTQAEAVAAGVPGPRVRRLLRSGLWVRVVGTVLAPASALPLAPIALAWSARLATGGVPSHLTAAAVLGLPVPPHGSLHVIVDPSQRVRVPGVMAHREPLEAPVPYGPPSARLLLPDHERVVVDCLRVLPAETGRTLAFAAVQRRIVTVRSLQQRADSLPGRRGLRGARTRIAELATGAHSVGEWRLHRLLLDAGIRGWLANQPLVVEGRVLLVPDIRFVDVPLVIEFDGRAYHEGERAWGADLERDLLCARLGLTVLRVMWDQVVRRPEQVLAAVRQALVTLGRAA